MLKLVAKRYVIPGKLDEYIAVAKGLVDQTRKEAGCIEYAL